MKAVRYSKGIVVCAVVTGVLAGSAQAQSIPGVSGGNNAMNAMPGMSGMTGGSGLMGNMLPSVSSASSGNVAGLLSYCVQNNYVSGTGATTALSGLTGKQGVTSSGDYTAGQQGQLMTGGNSAFSLSSLKAGLKQKMCSMVLSRAQNLL